MVKHRSTPNRPVNADARGSAVPCTGSSARAGYWERYAALNARAHRYQRSPLAYEDLNRSDSRNGPAVDHVFRTRNRGRPRRGQEDDQVRDFLRLGGAAKRNAAEAFHDDLLAALVVGAGLGCEALGQPHGRLGLDPAG